jgi:glycerophosphoryl diester phosphodiesterase
MLVIAHRGASGYEPENTVKAFEKAVELKADFVELDIQQTLDDKLAVLHDTLLKDKTKPSEITYAELRKKTNKDIPLLSDVFSALKNRIGINIEIKKLRNMGLLFEAIKGYDNNKLVFSSFNHYYLSELKKQKQELVTGVLSEALLIDPLSVLSSLKSDILVQQFEHVDKKYIDYLHSNKKKIYLWSVNTQSSMRKFYEMGADAIFTDYPDLALEAIK